MTKVNRSGHQNYYTYELDIKVLNHCTINPMPKQAHEGEWYDLRCAEEVKLKAGESCCISLGVSIELPKGYEAHIVPRSSTFKTWGIIQTNGMGIVDNKYCGEKDIWMMPVYATRDTEIHIGDRICQFRIMLQQHPSRILKVQKLKGKNRGGVGSTGTR